MEDARLAFNLGIALDRVDRPADSAAHFERALRLCRELAGDSAQTAKAAAGMGTALFKAGRVAEAETVLREALVLSRRFVPRRGLHAAEAPLWLGRCLAALQRPDEALVLFEEVLACVEGYQGVPLQLLAKIEADTAAVLETLGRAEEAALHRERERAALDAAAKAPATTGSGEPK
jgi:tetratricopeptide (TPR) repeat protein